MVTRAHASPILDPPEGRIVFYDVDWGGYEKMLQIIGDRHIHVTYDDGTMEVRMPSQQHERVTQLLGFVVARVADEVELDYTEACKPRMRNHAMTLQLEEAMRFAAQAHAGQLRKGSDTPYFEHLAAVGLILDRAGFPEDVVIAGLLHDVVEDTPVSFEELTSLFGATISDLVRQCSEIKTDEHGHKRPWIDRKRDHIAALASAPVDAHGIILADKLHNLISIELDLRAERPVWAQFHAAREQVLWYYHATIDVCGQDDPRLERLAMSCRDVLARVENVGGEFPDGAC
jgi:guanosine-3',5'-bis(diphosphate) 3'-pyrophosphohydrolase